jgi:hypothetical protein
MHRDDLATARMKRDLAELRRKIEEAERATAAMLELPDRTPDDEKRIAQGLEAVREARERAETMERFVEGGVYRIDVK